MPNHVTSIIKIIGEDAAVRHVLSSISGIEEDGSLKAIDFNKIIPMPESLKIESGSTTDMCIELFLTAINQKIAITGLSPSGRQEYIDIIKKLNVHSYITPYNGFLTAKEVQAYTEKILLLERDYLTSLEDMYRLGMTALDNVRKYGRKDWYDWGCENWGTKWNAYSTGSAENVIAFDTAWSAPEPIFAKLVEMFPDVDFEIEWADEDMGANTGYFRSEEGAIDSDYYPDHSKEAYETYIRCKGESECLGIDADGNYFHKNCEDCDGCD